MARMTAEEIVSMLLGGDQRGCVAVMIDEDWVGYLEEQEDGYDDRDEPILTATNSNEDEPFFSITMNNLESASIDGSYIWVKNDKHEGFTIHPLTKMKIN